jgi:hypothetical protein
MRKALQNRLPLLLLVSLGLLTATLFVSFKSNITCTDTADCTKRIEKQTIRDGSELLWESLSRQFVVSVLPE